MTTVERLSAQRERAARLIAWFGLLVPPAFVEVRPPAAVVEDPFTAITLMRGVGPAVCLLVAVAIARPLLRPLGVREWLLTGYLVVVAASALWSLAPRATLLKAAHLAVAYALLVLLTRTWRHRGQALRELTLIVHGVVVLAAITAVALPVRSRNEFTGRLMAVWPSMQSVTLGLFAAVALVLVAAAAGPPRLAQSRALRAGLGVIATVVLLLTGARAALVLAVVGVALVVALSRERSRMPRPWTAAVALAALVALVASPLGRTLRQRVAGDEAGSLVAFGGRLPLWDLVLQAVADRPLIGYGYFAGHRLGPYADLFYAQIDATQLPYVDGTWTETLLDLGVLGVVALLAFVAVSVRCVIAARDGSRDSALHLALLLVGILYSIQDFTLQQVGYPMILLGSLLLAPLDRRPDRDYAPS
jgi:exopolysaccharide production protein ExoQ